MCVNCFTNADFALANGVVAAAALSGNARHWLNRFGLGLRAPLARETRTVAFLRGLDLDPSPILGAGVVAAVDGRPAGQPARADSRSRSRGPSLAAAT